MVWKGAWVNERFGWLTRLSLGLIPAPVSQNESLQSYGGWVTVARFNFGLCLMASTKQSKTAWYVQRTSFSNVEVICVMSVDLDSVWGMEWWFRYSRPSSHWSFAKAWHRCTICWLQCQIVVDLHITRVKRWLRNNVLTLLQIHHIDDKHICCNYSTEGHPICTMTSLCTSHKCCQRVDFPVKPFSLSVLLDWVQCQNGQNKGCCLRLFVGATLRSIVSNIIREVKLMRTNHTHQKYFPPRRFSRSNSLIAMFLQK